MKKIFISQKMHMLTDEEIHRVREEAIADIKNYYAGEEISILDTFIYEDAPDDANRLWYLGKSIQMLGDADAIYICKGALDANGCNVEYTAALMYHIPIIWG